jgi:hypothetical protein
MASDLGKGLLDKAEKKEAPDAAVLPSTSSLVKRKVAIYCGGGCCACFCLAIILQLGLYWWATGGCGPIALKGMDWKAIQDADSPAGGSSVNLIPSCAAMKDAGKNWWGPMYALFAINGEQCQTQSATQKVGTFWRNWGPFWYTYTYKLKSGDSSKMLFYMRNNPWMPWMSYKMGSCDGNYTATFSEGSLWFKNKWRNVFHTSTPAGFYLYVKGGRTWYIDENSETQVSSDDAHPAYTIYDKSGIKAMATALVDLNSQTKGTWLLDSRVSGETPDQIPFWVTVAITLPDAFKIQAAGDKEEKEKEQQQDTGKNPYGKASLSALRGQDRNATLVQVAAKKPPTKVASTKAMADAAVPKSEDKVESTKALADAAVPKSEDKANPIAAEIRRRRTGIEASHAQVSAAGGARRRRTGVEADVKLQKV